MIRHADDRRDADFIDCAATRDDAVAARDAVFYTHFVLELDKRVEALSNDAAARLAALAEEIAGDFDLLLSEYRQQRSGGTG